MLVVSTPCIAWNGNNGVATVSAARDAAPTPTGFAEIVSDDFPVFHTQRSLTSEGLRREKNFACIRIFYFGSRRKAGDIDVTPIWRERTRN